MLQIGNHFSYLLLKIPTFNLLLPWLQEVLTVTLLYLFITRISKICTFQMCFSEYLKIAACGRCSKTKQVQVLLKQSCDTDMNI
jgi:hypothetical protein